MKARIGLGIVLIGIVLVLYTWATYEFFTRRAPGGNDFLAHYAAWQVYFTQGVNPYSDQAALYVQHAIYGRPALPGEDQNRLNYPFYSILVHGPFALIQNYPLARAVYMTLEQVAVFIGIVLCLGLFRWRPPTVLLSSVLAWSLLNYHTARGVLIGQFALLAFSALAFTLFFLQNHRDLLAGIIFNITLIKPPLVFLLAPFLIVWSIHRRRWHFIIAFFTTLALLVAGSFLVLPTWFGDWFERVVHYTEYTANQSPIWTVLTMLGLPGTILYVSILMGGLLWAWWQAWQTNDVAEFYWALGATLIVSNLISPRTATTDYVLMLVPTLGMFAALDRTPPWGRAVLVALLIVSLIGLWGLHIVTVQGNWEQAVMYLPWPLALGIVWLLGRRWLMERFKVES